MARVHSDEFKFFCDLCSRKAKLKTDIESHMKSHLQKEFKFPCENCSETFNVKQSLEMHFLMKHSDMPAEFTCDCGKSFKTLKHLRYHQKEKHNTGLYPCDKCSSRIFPSKVKLNRHRRGKGNDTLA